MDTKIKTSNDYSIDNLTDYGKGLEPKIDPRTNYGKGLEPKIDPRTNYGKGLEPKVDPRTNYGKGICYKAKDGKECATMEQVEAVNKAFYDAMMIHGDDSLQEEEQHKHRR